MNSRALSAVVFVVLLSGGVHSQMRDAPPLPFKNAGVCPYECCRYDDTWRSLEAVTLRTEPLAAAPKAFTLAAGERVTAMTGVVITTTAPGVRLVHPDWATVWDARTRVNHSFPGKPGDVFYLLAYHGEGIYTVWFRGRPMTVDGGGFKGQQECADLRAKHPGSGCSGEFIDDGQLTTEWWAHIRDRRGRSGWARMTSGLFETPSCH